MTDNVIDMMAYRRQEAQQDESTAVTEWIADLSESIDFRAWANDKRVTEGMSLMVQTSLATILEAFQVNHITHEVGCRSVSLPLQYQLLMAEGLTLRDFERLTVKRVSTILDVRLRVTEERDDEDKPFLQYIILDKLRVITSPR